MFCHHQWSDKLNTLWSDSTHEYFETVEYELHRPAGLWDIHTFHFSLWYQVQGVGREWIRSLKVRSLEYFKSESSYRYARMSTSKTFSWNGKCSNPWCSRPKICGKTRFWGRFLCQRLLSTPQSSILALATPKFGKWSLCRQPVLSQLQETRHSARPYCLFFLEALRKPETF